MAGQEKSVAKSVQEMSMEGDEPPPQYIVKGNSFGSKDSSALIPIPIIDVSLLSSEGELHSLRSSLTSAGCFQVWIYKTFQKPHLHCYLHVFQRTITHILHIIVLSSSL